MIITKNTRMSKYNVLQYILPISQTDLYKECGAFDLPKKIGWCKITELQDVPIKYLFQLWDIKNDNAELLRLTKLVFLRNTFIKRGLYFLSIGHENRLPLIDFTRLLIHTEYLVKLSVEKFNSCKIIEVDSRATNIYDKYKGNRVSMLIRYCKMFPMTMEQAMNVSWHDMYLAFKADSDSINANIEISQLEPLK